ncbi:MAG: lysophospholipid acyltransferase family protein [Spirochaetota bacterium]
MTLAPIIIRLFNVRGENLELIRRLRPPYVVLPNHASVWDPFFVNIFVPGMIHYVVSDANFRSKAVEFLLGLVGSIPKTKVMSDIDTVKSIMRIRDARGIVGIFPEGQNTWDGHSLPIYYSTAKLVKVLRVPVVTVHISGSFLSKARWAKRRRRGKVIVRFDLALSPEQLRKASVSEVDARIAEMLEHDEYEFNRIEQQKYYGTDRAEYAEIALFACPQCAALSTLRSHGNILECTGCGYAVRYNLHGFFRPVRGSVRGSVSGSVRFDTVRAWNLWQMDELRRRLHAFTHAAEPEPLFVEPEVTVEIGYKSTPLEPLGTGSLELLPDRILLRTPETVESFPIAEIEGSNVQNGERLEFYFRDSLYRVTILDPRGCTYKWDLAVRMMRELAASTAAV